MYECDVCTRKVRVPTNRHGLDVIQRCTITSGCQGKLHRVTSPKEINATPAFPLEMDGVQDWFARNILHTHRQTVRAATWTVKHNLQNIPVLHTFVYRIVDGENVLVEHEPAEVITVDANTTVLKFTLAEAGHVQCVSPASKNSVNFDGLAPVAASQDAVQLSSDVGELTIATLAADPVVSVVLTFPGTSPISVTYTDVDLVPSVDSPWVGTSNILMNGRRYAVRSFNVTTTPSAAAFFTSGAIANGTSFYVSHVNGVAVKYNEVIILMSTAPHASVDRVYTKYVDARSVSQTLPETYYSAGRVHTLPSVIKTTYPQIIVV